MVFNIITINMETIMKTKSSNAPMGTKKGTYRALYIRITPTDYQKLVDQATEDCRTMAGQVKYYVTQSIKKHNGIPF